MNDSRLVVKVIDLDLVSNEMEFLGEAVISMGDFDFLESPVHTAWYTLGPEVRFDCFGVRTATKFSRFDQTITDRIHGRILPFVKDLLHQNCLIMNHED